MAFPTVAARASSLETADVTSHDVSLPTGIASGNLLVVAFGTDGAPTVTWPLDWTPFLSKGGTVSLYGAYRIADGTEGATIVVTTSVAERSAHRAWRITGHHASSAPEEASVGGTSATPDPPSLSPSWGAEDSLFIAWAGWRINDATGFPASYLNTFQHKTGATSSDCTQAIGERELNAVSENPDTFTIETSRAWSAVTIAIRPAAAGGTTHDLAGVAIGEGVAVGDLSRILAMEGWALGEGVGAGELSRILALDGLAVGEGAAAGTLDVETPAPPAPEPVAFPRRPTPVPTYPEWSFTIDKRPVVIGGWQLGVDEFGPREASGMVDEDTARRIRPGSRLVGFVNGQPRWDGMIPKRPVVYQGVATINAFGWQFLAAEYRKRYLAQTRDFSQFSTSDGNPYNRVVSSQALQAKFDLQERAGSLQFRLGDGETFGVNEAHAFMMNARGSPGKITRYAFDWVTSALNNCEFRTFGWDWLNTNMLAINTATLGGATTGTMANTFAGRDQLEIQLATNAGFTLAQAWEAIIRNLRVNGRTTGDSWADSAIVADLCLLLGIDSSLVEASTLNALPFDQIGGSALDAMAHMAYLNDRPAPFISGDGETIWCAYHAWDKRTWTVHLATDAIPELGSIQPANQVRVTFPSVGGFQDEIIRTVEDLGLPNPYDGAPFDVRITREIDIPDVQPDSVLATAVGDLYLPVVSSDQKEGRLRIASARGPGGIQDPYGPLPGDTIRIADYGPAESMDLRISTVTWTKDEVAIGILAEATFGLIGRAALERMRVPGTDTAAPITGRMFVHQTGPSAYEGALAAWRKRKPRVHAKTSAKGKKVTKAEKKKVKKWKANKPQPWDFGSPGVAGTEALLGHGRRRRRRR